MLEDLRLLAESSLFWQKDISFRDLLKMISKHFNSCFAFSHNPSNCPLYVLVAGVDEHPCEIVKETILLKGMETLLDW